MSFNNISTEVTHCFSDADEIISPEPMGIMEQKFYLHETVTLEPNIGESSNNKSQSV